MSDPRYRPRDLAIQKALFGHHGYLQWKTAEGLEATAQLAAAQMHHQYAIRIRNRINAKGWSVQEYARRAGTSYDRMLKVLRGSAILRLEDIAIADLLVGEVSEFAVRDAVQLSEPNPKVSGVSADSPNLAAYKQTQEALRRLRTRRL